MSLRSNSSLSAYSVRPSLSPSHSTTSFYPKPAPALPNKTLHIANLRTGPYNDKTVQEELNELLSRQLGFCRVKICDNRNLVGCFGVAYFASIQCATDAMNNLQGHPFAGSGRGLRIDYMAQSKRETGSSGLDDDTTPASQLQRLPTQHGRGYLNDIPGPHWGYGPGVSPIDTSPDLPFPPPAGLAGGNVGSSAEKLGDRVFGFGCGAKASNMGLQESIYSDAKTSNMGLQESIYSNSNVKAPAPPRVSSGEKERVGVVKLKYTGKGKNIESKDLAVVGSVWNEQDNVPRDLNGGKAEVVDLLRPELLPELQSEQEKVFEDDPRQEKLTEVTLLGPGRKVADEQEAVNPEMALVSVGDGCAQAMEAEM